MALQKVKISSQTVQVDFEEHVGDTLEILFNWKDGEGQPVDMTGWTGLLQIKEAKTDATSLVERKTDDGTLILRDGTTEFNIETVVNASETAILGVGKKVYDLQLTSPAGKVNTLVVGSISLLQDNSR